MLDIITFILLTLGGLIAIAGGIGLIRFPDFYTRIHAAGITDTLCTSSILFALALQSGFNLVTLKLFLILGVLFLTSPTATHALAKAAKHSGIEPFLEKTK